jgi:hypothetical protein
VIFNQTIRTGLWACCLVVASLSTGCEDAVPTSGDNDATTLDVSGGDTPADVLSEIGNQTQGDASTQMEDDGVQNQLDGNVLDETLVDDETPTEEGTTDAVATTDLEGPAVSGGACTESTVCPSGGSGTATCRLDWPSGYCLVEDCAEHGHDCPGDPGLGGPTGESKCVLAPQAVCLALCETNVDCRPGYACSARSDAAGHGTAQVCVPE